MNFSTTKAPTVEPVSLQEVKDHLRIGDSARHDKNLTTLIAQQRRVLERELRRCIMDQTVTIWYDPWEEGGPIRLPRPDLIELASVTTYDDADAATTVSTSNYRVSDYGEPILESVSGTVGWTGSARRRKSLRLVARFGYVSVTTANGAGTAATTLNTNDACAHASRHEGALVRCVTRTAPADYRLKWQTTVSSVTDKDTVVLAAAQTWATGDTIFIGEVAYGVVADLKRRVTRHWRHTGEMVVGHDVADPIKDDLLRGEYYNVW